MTAGVLLGLAAALAMSLTYVLSRAFIARPNASSRALFGLSHAIMGVFSALLLPVCWTGAAHDVRAYVGPMLGMAGFYLAGQYSLFLAVTWTDASRVSPLLGLKVLMVALLSVLFLRQALTPLQWVAVAMSLIAAMTLNRAGGRIAWRSVAGVLCAVWFYSLSDLCIGSLTKVLSPDGGLRGSALGVCLCFLVGGAAGAVVVLAGRREDRAAAQWRAALPVALVWFVAQICMFACFRLTGVVFGNIIQAMRGPFSILLGVAIAALGHVHIERRAAPAALAVRAAAALLMVAAMGLFFHERTREAPSKPLPDTPGPDLPWKATEDAR